MEEKTYKIIVAVWN